MILRQERHIPGIPPLRAAIIPSSSALAYARRPPELSLGGQLS